MISQKEILSHFLPILEKNGEHFKKFTLVRAKKAEPGTWIITKTSDGVETKNQAKQGDMLVENQTSSFEQYLVKQETFSKKYEIEQSLERGWATYRPIGEILAYRVSNVDFEFFGVVDLLEFEAPWGETTVVKPGDYLVTSPEKNEIYRIAQKEFGETYKKA
ncbi:MAG: hypothetical protein PSV36_00530 [Algoriphagus sp.]|nr:hypothetical protein [Algoriphagus sp.]